MIAMQSTLLMSMMKMKRLKQSFQICCSSSGALSSSSLVLRSNLAIHFAGRMCDSLLYAGSAKRII